MVDGALVAVGALVDGALVDVGALVDGALVAVGALVDGALVLLGASSLSLFKLPRTLPSTTLDICKSDTSKV